ncbi:MAG: hypothetical protein GWO24_20140, partial [Akkermansiaceae bacterium]|nr:hypothetical protein [Akkermansiaceae bacterium]
RLADEMRLFNEHTPRSPLQPGQSGSLASLRESIRFSAASQPDDLALWESDHSTDWTVVYERSPELRISPLNRFAFVKPWPEVDSAAALGPVRRHL